jgi:uncharacterized protein DUF5990
VRETAIRCRRKQAKNGEGIKMIRSLSLRITLINPPPDVLLCLQQGKNDLVPPSSDLGEKVSFDFTVNIVNDRADGPPNFRGLFVQGPPTGRFIYINSGTYAGDADSCWSRRAKVPLSGITWELIEEALSASSAVLEARIAGTAGDGGPVCATVRLMEDGWKVQNTAEKQA